MNEVVEYKSVSKIRQKLEGKKYSLQFLPKILFPESLKPKIVYKDQSLKTAYLIDIVHNLILKCYFKKENRYNLSSIILKEKYGHLYNYYINYLVDKKVLILLKNHSKGKNARVYKLNDTCIDGEITRFKNCDKILLKKYKSAVCSIETTNFENNLILPEVKSKLIEDLFHIEIDYVKSIYFLDSSLQEVDIYQKNKYSVECIKDKHIFYHFDNFGRLHTNFTILKSFIRKNCLLIDGEETCEIDIKNSQPLFLNKILLNGLDKIDLDEFQTYRYLTLCGKFYQYLQEKFVVKDKQSVKEMTYKVLFGKNFKNKLDNRFSMIFPSIHQFIKDYKKDAKDYKALSYQLQRLESDFLFNKVIKDIMTLDSNIKILTCHDSIICKKSDKEIVTKIFNTKLKEEFDSISYDLSFNI